VHVVEEPGGEEITQHRRPTPTASARRLTGSVSDMSAGRQRRLVFYRASQDLNADTDSGATVYKTKLIAILALLFALGLTASRASAATPGEPWAASGTGTTTATADGTSGDAVLDYSVAGSNGAWTFKATAKTARQQSANWHYKGYHAWFQVRVGIEKFVIRNGQEIVKQGLAGAGPVNCCAAPSGGFDYSGTTSFDLQAGDVYGFRMTGSNMDSDRRLIGTLSLSLPTPAPAANDFDALVKSMMTQIDATTAQIKALQAKGSAMTAADMIELQYLMNKLNQQNEMLSNTVAKYGKTLDQIIANMG
jgi:hypothetical protein